jgi:hypothetical protein
MKNIHIYIIIILIAAVIILFWLWNGARSESIQKESVISELNAEIKYHVNEKGQLVAEKAAAIVDRDNMMKYYPQLVRDINTKLDVKTRNILAAMEARFTARGSGSVKITPVVEGHYTSDMTGPFLMDGEELGNDSTKSKKGTVTIFDGYLKLDGSVDGDIFDYKYDYSDTLLISFNSKKHFFKGETISVSGALSNRNAKITHTTGVMVKKIRPKRVVLSVGGYYDPFSQHFGPAITVGFPLISF